MPEKRLRKAIFVSAITPIFARLIITHPPRYRVKFVEIALQTPLFCATGRENRSSLTLKTHTDPSAFEYSLCTILVGFSAFSRTNKISLTSRPSMAFLGSEQLQNTPPPLPFPALFANLAL
jgi:hypothetical protein